jgi:hypothetical protein
VERTLVKRLNASVGRCNARDISAPRSGIGRGRMVIAMSTRWTTCKITACKIKKRDRRGLYSLIEKRSVDDLLLVKAITWIANATGELRWTFNKLECPSSRGTPNFGSGVVQLSGMKLLGTHLFTRSHVTLICRAMAPSIFRKFPYIDGWQFKSSTTKYRRENIKE